MRQPLSEQRLNAKRFCCPAPGCSTVISCEDVLTLLGGPITPLGAHFELLCVRHTLEKHGEGCICSLCGMEWLCEGRRRISFYICPDCQHMTCNRCGASWHPNMTCSQSLIERHMGEEYRLHTFVRCSHADLVQFMHLATTSYQDLSRLQTIHRTQRRVLSHHLV